MSTEIDPDEMKCFARLVASRAVEVASELGRLEASFQSLSSAWKDSKYTAFEQVFEETRLLPSDHVHSLLHPTAAAAGHNPLWDDQPTTSGIPFGFQSSYYDASSHLSQHGARWLYGATGRFTQPDPHGIIDGANVYNFGRNNYLVFGDWQGFKADYSNQGALSTSGEWGATKPTNASPVYDPVSKFEVGIMVATEHGILNVPKGGSWSVRNNGVDIHSYFPNGSNAYRINPVGHRNNPTPHMHLHLPGEGPGVNPPLQGPTLSIHGEIIPPNSQEAHWPLHP